MDNLDELLESIKAEAKRESALTLYKGTRQDDLVDEEVDERILRLLGLEDTFDIDYATYISLLREKMAAARMTGSQMVTEEAELLTNEFKRVKRKVGRFKLKKKKINIDSSESSFLPSLKSKKIKVDDVIPDSKSLKPQEETVGGSGSAVDAVSKELSKSSNILQRISEVLSQQLSLQKGAIREDKKESKDLNKEERERELEKKKSLTKDRKKAFGEFKAPAMGFFDTIKNYFKNILIGSVLTSIVKFFQDPENKKKLETFTNFIQDNVPLILGGLAFLALLPIATTILSFTGALLASIPILFKALAFFATPLGVKALLIALGVGAAVFGFNKLKEFIAGGKTFKAYDDMIRAEALEAGISPSPATGGALVLDEDGKPIEIPFFDNAPGRTVPSLSGRNYTPADANAFMGLGGVNARASLNLSKESHRDYIRENFGQEKLDQLMAANDRYYELLRRKDALKDARNEELETIKRQIRPNDLVIGGKSVGLHYTPQEQSQYDMLSAPITKKYEDKLSELAEETSQTSSAPGGLETPDALKQLSDQIDTNVAGLKIPSLELPNMDDIQSQIASMATAVNQGVTSSADPKQSNVPFFSANDPKNLSSMSTRSIYSLVD